MDSAIVTFADAMDEYEKAYKLGKKETTPMLVLDDILTQKNIKAPKEVPLGLVQVPINQIVGTKTAGRASAFSQSFYPQIKAPSEFATKWSNLYQAHLNEGIRDPIKAYEFMNQFFVEEGNKRVSVLKYFDAVSIPAYVTRIVPPWADDKETRIYYEFMEFYNLSQINYIHFSQPGHFAKLQRLVGKRPDEIWTKEEQQVFSSVYYRFESEYNTLDDGENPSGAADAFLFFIELYEYHTLDHMTTSELRDTVEKAWEEFKLLTTDASLELQMEPGTTDEGRKNLLSRLLPLSTPKLQVAFIHERSKEFSSWTYSHELGRMHLQEVFDDEIITSCYDHATGESTESMIEKAIADGNKVIFTTSASLHKASLKAALAHPEVKILNCSLNTPQKNMRTYYARMYEAKFLIGAIAGAISQSGNIGYIADYPIYGIIANINAFALGAKMVNPRAKIYLEWSTVKDHDIYETFALNNVNVISGQDMLIPGSASRQFGLYRTTDNMPINLAMPLWQWGEFYERLIRKVIAGSWKSDETEDETKGLNYYWGMSAQVVDVIYSKHLPIGTSRLIELLKSSICEQRFNPFSGILYSQEGLVQDSVGKDLSPEEIVKMEWLAENVIGTIPTIDTLIDQVKPVVITQGVETTEKEKA